MAEDRLSRTGRTDSPAPRPKSRPALGFLATPPMGRQPPDRRESCPRCRYRYPDPETAWGRLDVAEGHEVVVVVLQPILAVLMRVQAGVDDRSAPAARRRAGEGVVKDSAFGREPVNARGRYRVVSVTANRLAHIVGNDEEDVLLDAAILHRVSLGGVRVPFGAPPKLNSHGVPLPHFSNLPVST